MEKSIPYYLNHMTSSNLKKFKKLISCHYRKFIRFYWLVADYSDIISKVKYEFHTPEQMDVELIFKTRRKIDKIQEKLEESIETLGYEGSMSNDGKKTIFLSLILEEEPEPEDTDEDSE